MAAAKSLADVAQDAELPPFPLTLYLAKCERQMRVSLRLRVTVAPLRGDSLAAPPLWLAPGPPPNELELVEASASTLVTPLSQHRESRSLKLADLGRLANDRRSIASCRARSCREMALSNSWMKVLAWKVTERVTPRRNAAAGRPFVPADFTEVTAEIGESSERGGDGGRTTMLPARPPGPALRLRERGRCARRGSVCVAASQRGNDERRAGGGGGDGDSGTRRRGGGVGGDVRC